MAMIMINITSFLSYFKVVSPSCDLNCNFPIIYSTILTSGFIDCFDTSCNINNDFMIESDCRAYLGVRTCDIFSLFR